jgi:hypothetical protein
MTAQSCSTFSLRVMPSPKEHDEFSIVTLTLLMKALLWIFGLMVVEIVNPTAKLNSIRDCFQLWSQWDANQYLKIAQNGYGPVGDKRLMLAFWPVYPLMIRAGTLLVRNYLASQLIVSTVASIIASLELYWLVLIDHQRGVAFFAVWFLLIFPTSYFLHIGYTESLFLALALGSFLAGRRGSWLIAGSLATVAAATHINGILLMPALSVEALQAWRNNHIVNPRWLWIGLPSLGLLAYMLFGWRLTGDPLVFLTVQRENWADHAVWPWQGLAASLGVAMHWGPPNNQIIGVQVLLFMLATGAATICSAVLLRPSYTVWMASNWLLLSCQSWNISAPRVLLCLFPMFILMAKVSSSRLVHAALTAWSLLWLGTFVGQFVAGHWTF